MEKGEDLLGEADQALIRGIVERSRREAVREGEAIDLRLDGARAEARRLAQAIASLPEVRRVLLFGSTATGRGFRLDSDIDLALEGGDILAAMAIAERSAFPVDLVDLDRLPPGFRASILEEGVVIHAEG